MRGAHWIPAFFGKTPIAISLGNKIRRTPFCGHFQAFLLQTPRRMAFYVFCFALSKGQT